MDEKKKIIVMAALFLVVIGVGAFQFSSVQGPTEDPGVKKRAEEEKKLAAEKKKQQEEQGHEILNPMFAQNLPPRDPFAPGKLADEPLAPPAETPQPKPLKPSRSFKADPGFKPFDPGAAIPELPKPGALEGTIGLQASTPIRPADQLAYTLKGVLLGEKPMAVLQDESGNQRLVALGASIDGDSRVTDISQGKVTVRHKGKTVTLTVGANANEK